MQKEAYLCVQKLTWKGTGAMEKTSFPTGEGGRDSTGFSLQHCAGGP